ncbi:CYTH domain-containing protein [Candidatus Woesebacteria bacterium]|nr:CYTH domain-containing protein [Candidatus Woesebacteria bacterium]
MMDTEYEVKFYPVDKEEIRKKLKKLGAKLVFPERKMRRAIIDGRKHKQLKCEYIRVRDEGDSIRLNAKTHAKEGGKISDQKELEVQVGDYEKTIEILKQMGFRIDRYQETLRETWEYDGAEVFIDTWPGLEPRLEIEAYTVKKIKEVAKKLEFSWDKKIITSITELYMKVYNLDVKETIKKITYLTFENNPFKGLRANHNI